MVTLQPECPEMGERNRIRQGNSHQSDASVKSMMPCSKVEGKARAPGHQSQQWYFHSINGMVPLPVGVDIFLFSTTSRSVLGPTQHPTQSTAGTFPAGIKQLQCVANSHLHLVLKVRKD
jgi:hypothetical protein